MTLASAAVEGAEEGAYLRFKRRSVIKGLLCSHPLSALPGGAVQALSTIHGPGAEAEAEGPLHDFSLRSGELDILGASAPTLHAAVHIPTTTILTVLTPFIVASLVVLPLHMIEVVNVIVARYSPFASRAQCLNTY